MFFNPLDFEQLLEFHHHAPSVASALANLKISQGNTRTFEMPETEFETMKTTLTGLCLTCGAEHLSVKDIEECAVCQKGKVFPAELLMYLGRIKLVF